MRYHISCSNQESCFKSSGLQTFKCWRNIYASLKKPINGACPLRLANPQSNSVVSGIFKLKLEASESRYDSLANFQRLVDITNQGKCFIKPDNKLNQIRF
ncbi:uncharacterized protein ASCRUDRAFT_8839 [Ascoidea rubescens DSM 1968]|uniref:Uncharacterized protein n=1 Tax=Ascoidea rubescens DSM 1968 TaxID=1344418 RepID=A0A1D2VEF2_9ASCO|nr:hypothetical protein ASCRUDRAFT_8839 [Ascoidea rubescens DSM 1968]ODV60064.1 hypothetical protein ASCRUDRAFT_8839 [Ascoidea rubescens DSM 1968]